MSRFILANERQARHLAAQRPGWRCRSRRLSKFVEVWEITDEPAPTAPPYDWASEAA